jgi:HAD superfamily hydrolase (TIGR01549 family)
MPPPRPAVTLDLWHTLVYLEPEAEERYMLRQVEVATQVLRGSVDSGAGPRPSDAALRSAFEKEYADAVSASQEGRTVTPDEQFARAARATGLVPRPDAYRRALARFVQATPFQRAPGAIEMMRELRDDGYRLGVISNTVGEHGRLFRPLLRRMGFDEFVTTYTFSDEHPWTKPSPELFRWSLTGLGSDPSVAVHVGDGWSDIEGARRAAMRGAILFTGLQQYGARYRALFLPPGADDSPTESRAETLAEVVPIVRRLMAKRP